MDTRALLLNSAVAFAVACLVMVTAHEAAHAVAALAQGNHPVVHGFSVEDGSRTDRQDIVTALAGPFFSLVSGLVVLGMPTGRLGAFWALTVLWTGLLSVQEFSGYLITGPFAHVGDIGSALETSGAPGIVGWIGFVLGWAITYLLGRHAVRRLARFTSRTGPFAPQLRAVGLFAWLLGVAAVIVLSLGLLGAGDVPFAVVAFEALGLLTSGIFLVFVRLVMAGAEPGPSPSLTGLPVAGTAVLLVLALGRQLVLAGGIG